MSLNPILSCTAMLYSVLFFYVSERNQHLESTDVNLKKATPLITLNYLMDFHVKLT